MYAKLAYASMLINGVEGGGVGRGVQKSHGNRAKRKRITKQRCPVFDRTKQTTIKKDGVSLWVFCGWFFASEFGSYIVKYSIETTNGPQKSHNTYR